MPKTLILDLDGTLIDTAPDLVGTLNRILVSEGIGPLPLKSARNYIGQGAKALLMRGFAASGKNPSNERAEALTEAFIADYAAHIAEQSRPFPGAIAAIDRFSRAGWKLAICTNKLESLSKLLLDNLGLSQRFAAITGGDTFGVGKPDPRSLIGTIEAAGGILQGAVMVGDSASDINAARAAGIPVVAVDFGYTEVPVRDLRPDAVIGAFGELWEAVAGLKARRS